jgi:predicted transcriptional regulator
MSSLKGNIQDVEALIRNLNRYDIYLKIFDKNTYIELADLANDLEYKLQSALEYLQEDLKNESFSNSLKDEIEKKGFNTDKIEVYSV